MILPLKFQLYTRAKHHHLSTHTQKENTDIYFNELCPFCNVIDLVDEVK